MSEVDARIEAQIQWLRAASPVRFSDFLDLFFPGDAAAGLALVRTLCEAGLPLSLEPTGSALPDPLVAPKAYQLVLGVFAWLDAAAIKNHWLAMHESSERSSSERVVTLRDVYAQAWVDSTQAWASAHLQLHPVVQSYQAQIFLVEYQSAGRGRMGRQWRAPFGGCVMMTLALRMPAEDLHQRLSPCLALSLCERLRALTGLPVQVKWPNDLWLNGAKLAGCLIQSQGFSAGVRHQGVRQDWVTVFVGLGVNLVGGSSLEQPWAGLWANEAASTVEKNLLAAHLIDVLMESLVPHSLADLVDLQAKWRAYDAFGEQLVTVVLPNGERISGLNLGIDTHGQLQIHTAAGELRTFCVGEVSLRPLNAD